MLTPVSVEFQKNRTVPLWRKVRIPAFLRMLVPPILHFTWKILKLFFRPDFVFLVYGSSSDRSSYLPPARDEFFPTVFPIGLIRWGKNWGLIGGTVLSVRDLVRDSEKAEKLLRETVNTFPKAKRYALAGQLPGVCIKAGLSLEVPFVNGIQGTVFAMLSAARELAKRIGKAPEEIDFALLGAAGTIGSQLLEELRVEFRSVVAFDPRYRISRQNGNVLYTFENADLQKVQAVLVLTAKGDDIQAYAEYFVPGTHVADDTHPCMSPDLLFQLESRGVVVWKATTLDNRLKMYPRLPNFRSDDTPGCLLEAVVSLVAGAEVLRDQRSFNEAATRLGFSARLAPHPDV